MQTNYFLNIDKIIKILFTFIFIFTLCTLFGKYFHIRFDYFAYSSLLISTFVTYVISFLILKESQTSFQISDHYDSKSGFFLLFITLLIGSFAIIINSPEEDDSMYVGQVMYNLSHPYTLLDDKMNWLAPWSDSKLIENFFLKFMGVYEYLLASISFVFHIDFLILYHIVGSFFWGSMLFIVYFYILNRFFEEMVSIVGAFVTIFIFIFIFKDSGNGYGIFFSKIWIGKTILQIISLPLIFAFIYDYYNDSSKQRWFYVFVVVTSSLAFSTSSLFLTPLLVGSIIFIPFVLSLFKFDKNKLLVNIYLLSTLFIILYIALFNYVEIKNGISDGINKELGYIITSSLFKEQYKGFFGDFISFSSIVIFVCFIVLFMTRNKYKLVFYWAITSIGIFVNPLTDNLVATYLVSHLNYGRVFFIVPLLLMIGLTFSTFFQFFSKYVKESIIFTIVGLSFLSYIFFRSSTLEFANNINAYWIGKPQLLSPAIKVDKLLEEEVKQIIKLLPEGNTLSTIKYTYVISMLSGKYPQYYSNPYSSIPLFGKISKHENDAIMRMKAVQYLLGNINSKPDFIRLLHTNVQNLVVDTYTNEKMDIYNIAIANDFYQVEKNINYVLYTKKVIQ